MPDIYDSIGGNYSVPSIGADLTLTGGYSNTVTISDDAGNDVSLVGDGVLGHEDVVTDESATVGSPNVIDLSDGSYAVIRTLDVIDDQINISGGSTANLYGAGGNTVNVDDGSATTINDHSSGSSIIHVSGTGGNTITVTGTGDEISDDPTVLTNTIVVSSGTVTEGNEGNTVDISGSAGVNGNWTYVNVSSAGGNTVAITGTGDLITDDSSTGNTLALNGDADSVLLSAGASADTVTNSATGVTLNLVDDNSGSTNVMASDDTINVGGSGGSTVTIAGTGDSINDDPWVLTNTIAVSSGTVREGNEGNTVDISGSAGVNGSWTYVNVSGGGGDTVAVAGTGDLITDDSSAGNTLALDGDADSVILSAGASADTVTDSATGITLNLVDDNSGSTNVTAGDDTINVGGSGGSTVTIAGTDHIFDDPWVLTNTIAVSSGVVTDINEGNTVDVSGSAGVNGNWTYVNVSSAGGNTVAITGTGDLITDDSSTGNTLVLNGDADSVILSAGASADTVTNSATGVTLNLVDDNSGSTNVMASDDTINVGGSGGSTVTIAGTGDSINDDPWVLTNTIAVSSGTVREGNEGNTVDISGSAGVNGSWTYVNVSGGGGDTVAVAGTGDLITDDSSAGNTLALDGDADSVILSAGASADTVTDSATGITLNLVDDNSGSTNVTAGDDTINVGGSGGSTVTIAGTDHIFDDPWVLTNTIAVSSGVVTDINGGNTVDIDGTATVYASWTYVNVSGGSTATIHGGGGNAVAVDDGSATLESIYEYSSGLDTVTVTGHSYANVTAQGGEQILIGESSTVYLFGAGGNTIGLGDGSGERLYDDSTGSNTIRVGGDGVVFIAADHDQIEAGGGSTTILNGGNPGEGGNTISFEDGSTGDTIHDFSSISDTIDVGSGGAVLVYAGLDQIGVGQGSMVHLVGAGGNTITVDDGSVGNEIYDHSTASNVINVSGGSGADIDVTYANADQISVAGAFISVAGVGGDTVAVSGTGNSIYEDSSAANTINVASGSGLSLSGATISADSVVVYGMGSTITADQAHIELFAGSELDVINGDGNTVVVGTNSFINDSGVYVYTYGWGAEIAAINGVGNEIAVEANTYVHANGLAINVGNNSEAFLYGSGNTVTINDGIADSVFNFTGEVNTIDVDGASTANLFGAGGQTVIVNDDDGRDTIYDHSYSSNTIDMGIGTTHVTTYGNSDQINIDGSYLLIYGDGGNTISVAGTGNEMYSTVADFIEIGAGSALKIYGFGGNIITADEAGESITDDSNASDTININSTSAGNTTVTASNDVINLEASGTSGGSITLSGDDDDTVNDLSSGGNTVDLVGNTNADVFTNTADDDVISVYSVNGDSGNSSVTIYGDGGNTIVTNEANETVTDKSNGTNTIEVTDVDSNGNNSQITASDDTIYFESAGMSRGSGVMLMGGTDDTVDDLYGGNLIILNGNTGADITASNDMIGAIGTTAVAGSSGSITISGDDTGTVTGTNDTIAVQGSSTVTATDYSIALYGATVDLEGGGGNTVSFSGDSGTPGTNVIYDNSSAVSTFDVSGGYTTINTCSATVDDIIYLSGGNLKVSDDDAINVASGATASIYGSGGNTVNADSGSVVKLYSTGNTVYTDYTGPYDGAIFDSSAGGNTIDVGDVLTGDIAQQADIYASDDQINFGVAASVLLKSGSGDTIDIYGGSSASLYIHPGGGDTVNLGGDSGGNINTSDTQIYISGASTITGLNGAGGNTITATGNGNSIYDASSGETVDVNTGSSLVSLGNYSGSSVTLAATDTSNYEFVNATGDTINIDSNNTIVYVWDSAFNGTSSSDSFNVTGTNDTVKFVTAAISAAAAFGVGAPGSLTVQDSYTGESAISLISHP